MLDKALTVLKQGGFTLSFIVFLSIVALAVAIERGVLLWRFLDRARRLAETVKRCLYRGALAEARAACERSSSPAAELFLIGFERYGRSSPQALEAAVDRERQRISMSLKGATWLLGTIGATAPFIGLFGTVVGIMHAFNEIGAKHAAGIDVVGPGIAEALITTAFGIAVGIEAVMIYNFFQSRMMKTVFELKLIAEEFVELLQERSHGEPRLEIPGGLADNRGDRGRTPHKEAITNEPEREPGPVMGSAAELGPTQAVS